MSYFLKISQGNFVNINLRYERYLFINHHQYYELKIENPKSVQTTEEKQI